MHYFFEIMHTYRTRVGLSTACGMKLFTVPARHRGCYQMITAARKYFISVVPFSRRERRFFFSNAAKPAVRIYVVARRIPTVRSVTNYRAGDTEINKSYGGSLA